MLGGNGHEKKMAMETYYQEENQVVTIADSSSIENVIQNKINKGILKFPKKKETMVIAEDSLPLVVSVNITNFDLRGLIDLKKEKRRPLYPNIRNVWIPKQFFLEYKTDLMSWSKLPLKTEERYQKTIFKSFI